MSDKFRTTFPIPVSFVDGEEPPAAKWDAVSSQARNGLALLEAAVGDIWNQSGDPVLDPGGDPYENALWIPNIGRTIGRQSMLNPRVPNVSTVTKYTDVFSIAASGVAELQLNYTPVPAGSSLVGSDFTINSVTPAGAIVSSDYQSSINTVSANGDFFVSSTGRLTSFTPVTALSITYKPSIASDVSNTSQWNVVPDPNTNVSSNSNYMGLKLAYKNGTSNAQGYWLYLPPRRALAASRLIGNSPVAVNNSATAGGEWFFQPSTSAPAQDINYRYQFPIEISTTIADAVSITQLPSGFLYLFDNVAGTIVEGLTYSADVNGTPPGNWVIIVSGPALDSIVAAEPSLLSSNMTDSIADYQSRFSIIFPGNSVANAISAVVANHGNHTHTGVDSSQAIPHGNLTHHYGSTDIPPGTLGWTPSGYQHDHHIQYLHRRGYDGTNRDLLGNGMAGDLLFLDSVSNSISNTHDSHRLVWGTSAISTYYRAVDSAVVVSGSNLEIINAGAGQISFDGTTNYINGTRAAAYYSDIHFQKTYQAIIASSNFTTSSASAVGITGLSITFTVPAGLTADVAAFGSFSGNAGASTSVAAATLAYDANAFGTLSYLLASSSTNANYRVDGVTTGLAAGSHTIAMYLLSDGTHTATVLGGTASTTAGLNVGQLTVIVSPRI